MTLRFFILAVFVATPLAAGADEVQKLRSRGAEVYYLDADLRAAYAKANPQGLPDSRRKLPRASAATFDWSTLARRPYSYTQRVTPYCWAFAAVTAFEWNWAVRNGGPAPVLAIQPIIDRTKKEGGASHTLALEVLLEHGTCLLSSYPYTGKPAPLKPNTPLTYRAIAWGPVALGNDFPTPAQLKEALLEHGPLLVSVNATPQFEAYKGGVFREHAVVAEGKQLTNHSLVILGWDDRKGKGCWKVQNSWGPKWGDVGCMWIEYGCNSIGHQACWVRAQASHYQMPENTHKLVTGELSAFPRFPKAAVLAPAPQPNLLKLTAPEAVKQQGKRVEVEFAVKAAAIRPGSGDIELRSTVNTMDEECLIVWILKSEMKKFTITDPQELLKSFKGKTVRIRGSVQPMSFVTGVKMVVEIGDPRQIEVVE